MSKSVFVIDFGGRSKTAYLSENGGKVKEIPFKEVLNLPETLPSGSVLISEKAHLGCPKESSLAQPFKAEELLLLYKRFRENNITLKLFPEKQTPVALSKYQMKHKDAEKSDELDPIIIYEYIISTMNISMLQNPPTFFESRRDILYRQVVGTPKNKREEGWIAKRNLDEILNIARRDEYDLDGLDDDQNAVFIEQNLQFIYDRLVEKFDKDLISEIFGIDFFKKDGIIKIKTKSGWQFKMGLMYTILATLRKPDGSLILRKNGRFFSVKDIWRYVICASPCHMRGGIARSNIYWHGFRNYLRKLDVRFKRKIKIPGDNMARALCRSYMDEHENDLFVEERLKYMNVLKELNRIYRCLLMPEVYNEYGKVEDSKTLSACSAGIILSSS